MVKDAAKLGIKGNERVVGLSILLESVSMPAVSREHRTSLNDHGNGSRSLEGLRRCSLI